jgi:hypothetical protein
LLESELPNASPEGVQQLDRARALGAVDAMLEFQRRNQITTGGMTIKQMIEDRCPR